MNPLPLVPIDDPSLRDLYPGCDTAFLMDNSGYEDWQACPRLFQLKQIDKRVLVANRAGRNFGSAMHVGWDTRYKLCDTKTPTPEQQSTINESMFKWFKEHPQPSDDFRNYDHACKVMERYQDQYGQEQFKILRNRDNKPLIEVSFTIPLGTVQNILVISTGKLDMGVEDSTGRWVLDHKTAFQFGDSFNQDMGVNGGQLGYVNALMKSTGEKVVGYIIDAVRIRRPSKAAKRIDECPIDSTDFMRIPYIVSEDNITEWREDTLEMVSSIMWHHDRGTFPRHRKACVTKYGPCDFYDLCTLPRNQREGQLKSTMYEENTWSPLVQRGE